MRAELRDRRGSGEAVVYVPGIDGTGDYLLATEARLAERFEVTTLRYLEGGEDTHAALAASIAEVLDAQGLARCVLLAESFGVAVALQLALDDPGRARALLLVNGFARFERRARLALSMAFAPLVSPKLYALGRPLAARVGLFGNRREPETLGEFLAMEPGAIDAAYRARLGMIQHVDLLPRLHTLERPVTLIASDRDKVVPAIPAARAMQERLPDAELEILPGAGHLVLPLRSEPWIERIESLLERAGD